MNRTVLRPGEPVRNLQYFLRTISYYYNTVPAVIPDGIFSDQTREAVMGFQKTFKISVTGIVDFVTWNRIIAVYNEVYEYEEACSRPMAFPATDFSITLGDSPMCIYIIQAMLRFISMYFANFTEFNISGMHDAKSVDLVKQLQKLFNVEQNGVIDKKTFDMISALYNNNADKTFEK